MQKTLKLAPQPKPLKQENIRPLRYVAQTAAATACSNLAHNFKTLRKSRKVSQEELGKILNLHQTAICRIEKAHQSLTPEELFIFAECFEVSVDDLFKARALPDGTFVK